MRLVELQSPADAGVNHISGKISYQPFDATNPQNLAKLKTYILQHCSEYVSALLSTRRPLFRGLESVSFDCFIGSSDIGRKPRDTAQPIQNKIDKKLVAAGYTALRSNSIFCSTDAMRTSHYGKRFYIFPFDGFSCTWSSKIDDLTQYYSASKKSYARYQRMNRNPDQQFKLQGTNTHDLILSFDLSPEDFVKQHGFNNGNLARGLKTYNEILIRGSYLACSVGSRPECIFKTQNLNDVNTALLDFLANEI